MLFISAAFADNQLLHLLHASLSQDYRSSVHCLASRILPYSLLSLHMTSIALPVWIMRHGISTQLLVAVKPPTTALAR